MKYLKIEFPKKNRFFFIENSNQNKLEKLT